MNESTKMFSKKKSMVVTFIGICTVKNNDVLMTATQHHHWQKSPTVHFIK